jgi:hypothetical protein
VERGFPPEFLSPLHVPQANSAHIARRPAQRFMAHGQGTQLFPFPHDPPPGVADQPQHIPAGFTAESQSELTEAIRVMARSLQERSRIIDEYHPQNINGDSETVIQLQPQFERLWAIIDHIVINGPSQGSIGLSFQGSTTAPGANANILLIGANAIPPGNYTGQWKIDLDGTPGAADVNNVKVVQGVTIVPASANDGAVGSYPQVPFQFTVPPNNANTLTFKAIGAATAGAIYTVSVDIIPNGGFPVTLQLGDRFWNLVIPATGILEISPKRLMLAPYHQRILTATFPGQYALELLGYADVRNRT